MPALQDAVDDFLAQKCIAVAGVSRTRKNEPANLIYRKLHKAGYQVFPVNPHAETVEGDRCYPDLESVPAKVDGVVIATRAEVAEEIVRQCAEAGISRVWMHRALKLAGTSVSDAAVQLCRENNIAVIPGGCPMMFCEPVDLAHKCLRWVLNLTGGLPKQGL